MCLLYGIISVLVFIMCLLYGISCENSQQNSDIRNIYSVTRNYFLVIIKSQIGSKGRSMLPIKEHRPLDRKSVAQTVSYGEKIELKYFDVKIYDVLDGLRKCAKILSY